MGMSFLNEAEMRGSLPGIAETVRGCLGSKGGLVEYLIGAMDRLGIDTVYDVTPEVLSDFRRMVSEDPGLSQGRKRIYGNQMEAVVLHGRINDYPKIREKVLMAHISSSSIRRKTAFFMIMRDIREPSGITYEDREAYVRYLTDTISRTKVHEYVKCLDQMKLEAIWEADQIRVEGKIPPFEEKAFYLPYYPDYRIASRFYYSCDRDMLVFDFSRPVPVKMKKQIWEVLNIFIRLEKTEHLKRQIYLNPLWTFYRYLLDHPTDDIQMLHEEDNEAFLGTVRRIDDDPERIPAGYGSIMDKVQKTLFLHAEQVPWNAEVWYMERFSFRNDRMNPAEPVTTFRFEKVRDPYNNRSFKLYIKYLIGVTDRALNSIQLKHYVTGMFLEYLETEDISIRDLDSQALSDYFAALAEHFRSPRTYNTHVREVFGFLRYMRALDRVPQFSMYREYYLKKEHYRHKNRSLNEQQISRLLEVLPKIPLMYRLIFLHFWCLGLRVNEVCRIRADGYTYDGNTAWLTVHQNKMRADKKIPIPLTLYELMIIYCQKNRRDGYVFLNDRGGMMKTNFLVSRMKRFLHAAGLKEKEYSFRPHDLRHTLATMMFRQGVPLQVIREYFGHTSEEMTKLYIDWPEIRAKENADRFFSEGSRFGPAERWKEEENENSAEEP